MRPRTNDHVQAQVFRDSQETRHVETRLDATEVELSSRALVHAPRHVRVDEAKSERLDGFERRTPDRGVETPVVNGAGQKGQNATTDSDPFWDELDAADRFLSTHGGAGE